MRARAPKVLCIHLFRIFLIGIVSCLLQPLDYQLHAQEQYPSVNTISHIPKDTSDIRALLHQGEAIKLRSADSALLLFQKALMYSLQWHYNRGITNSLLEIGNHYLVKEQYQTAKNFFFRAMPYAQTVNKTAYIYNALGIVYMKQGISDSAVYAYYNVLNTIDQKKKYDTALLVNVYGNLGAALVGMGQTDQSFYYLYKAKRLAAIYNPPTLSGVYQNIGTAYVQKGNYDSSLAYFRLALRENLRQHNNRNAQDSYCAIGANFLMQKKAHDALIYLDSAVDIDEADAKNISILQQNLGDAYSQLGEHEKALTYYKRALIVSNRNVSPRDNLYIYHSLASTYEAIGQYRLAYKYQKAFSELIDSVMSDEKIKAVNQLEVKYRLSEKDKELSQNRFQLYKQKKQAEQKNIWMGIIIFISYVLITFIFFFYNNKRKIRKIMVQQEERDRIARDLHDGMGALLSAVKMNYTMLGKHNNISTTETYNDGMQLLNEMRDELRSVAYNLVPEMMTKQNLADAIHILCNRMQKNNIVIDVQVYGDFAALPQDLYFSIYRIVEELLNNSIKHAEASEMLVQLMRHEDKLQITVEDNGKGFDPDKINSGMGLHNLRKRMQQLNGQLLIISKPGMGTSIELEIPYKTK